MPRRLLALLAVLAPLATARADDRPLLLRYPTLHGDDVVFVAAGNLWRVARTGGTAVRLTADAGQDIMPRFSPDGRWIAYTASDPGNEDVYVRPAAPTACRARAGSRPRCRSTAGGSSPTRRTGTGSR